MNLLVLPLASAEATLAQAGGKGTNLAALARAGFPVPPGFIVTTAAYHAFVAANHLAPRIQALLPPDSADLGALTTAAAAIQDLVAQATLPAALAGPIEAAYRALPPLAPPGPPAVAVRSSATAEDLPGMSFAGQHETYLNIAGAPAVLAAIQHCWGSLWTARAIGYRARQTVPLGDLALAVVVQVLVPAEVAGVAFTANPLTGAPHEIVINAAFGLGEAVVAGLVTPDQYIVDTRTWQIRGRALGRKELALIPGPGGAIRRVPRDGAPVAALADPQILALARIARRVADHYGTPQDIEWAYAGGQWHLLQARPLTARPPAGSDRAAPPPRRYTRLQRAAAPNALEHLPLPLYPFDYSLFVRPLLTRAFRALRGVGLALPALDSVLVPLAEGVVQLVPPPVRPTMRLLCLPWALGRVLRADPAAWLAEYRRTVVALALRLDAEDLTPLSDQEIGARIAALQRCWLPQVMRRFIYFPRGLLAGLSLTLLLRLCVGRAAPRLQTALLAAIPCTTTAANQALDRLAARIRASVELRAVFAADPDQIPARLGDSAPGRALRAAVDSFLARYGYRESAMPAAALPAWRDDPRLVYGLLKGLAASPPDSAAEPHHGPERARRAWRAVVAARPRTPWGIGRRALIPLVRRALRETRRFLAFREDSHFYMCLPFPVIRRLALVLGWRWVQRGLLEQADDIFFLELAEVRAPGPAAGVRAIVQRRRQARQAVEGRYTAVPAELLRTTAGAVQGAAVSPGQVIGRVRIIRREQDFWTLQRGEVLVAPYTNPAWTPLFALAGAVVVDAGGVASHAAIVAREYGIPGVMGTRHATQTLHTGQRVLVDGDRGRVVPLADPTGRSEQG